jgi:hypothetical protein
MKHRGQDVLASVLLHVIEAPVPVNNSLHRTNCNGLVDNVDYFIFCVEHIHHARISKPPGIVRLAPGTGIKRGAIKFYSPQCSSPGAGRSF